MNKVAVIDYGMGNLHSVAKAVEHVGAEIEAQTGEATEVIVTADACLIAGADRVVFPGVGAIRDCMAEIERLNVGEIVKEAMKTKPVLAICVGMQALMGSSEENGGVRCLGLMEGEVKFFGDDHRDKQGMRLKVPHMGWNQVKQVRPHPLWQGIPDDTRFYFVHSYYVPATGIAAEFGITDYGLEFVACMAANNIFATQFHPEKSQAAGLALYRNFLQWDGSAQ